ncbi:MAG: sensor histidine kinase [Ekhidna sp.]
MIDPSDTKHNEQQFLAKFTLLICIFSLAIYIFYIWYGWSIDRLEISAICSLYMMGSLIALFMNLKGKDSIAKMLVISTASISVVFTYHIFTIGFSILNIFFPIALGCIYLFDIKKELRWLKLTFTISFLIFISNFLFERFSFLKIELSEELATQVDHVHNAVAIIITGFLLIVSIQNKNRINKVLQEKNEIIESTLTELTETRDQLIQAEKMSSLGLMTAGINHEINNPLNFMAGGLELLRDVKESEAHETINKFFFIFEEGINRISKIVNSLNHFNHNASLDKKECDIQFIINNCLTILNHQLKNKIALEKKFAENNHVVGNSSQLHQVFINLISNAIQAIKNAGVISISTEIKKDMISVRIKDTGEGIHEDVRGKIFDPFFTTKEPGVGTGLGLFISYKIIKDHDGDIRVDSDIKNGTEFHVILPIKGS